jgi:hypothetical protein
MIRDSGVEKKEAYGCCQASSGKIKAMEWNAVDRQEKKKASWMMVKRARRVGLFSFWLWRNVGF